MILAEIKDQALITINTLELLGIIYLALAISALRERLARIEGHLDTNGRKESRLK